MRAAGFVVPLGTPRRSRCAKPATCLAAGKPMRAPTSFDPDDPAWDLDYACIPQTIEYSVREAQKAVAEAFCDDITRVSLQMPMGRSRKHWYRMSPMKMWFEESSVLAPHFCEVFKGASIALVLCCEPMPPLAIPWIDHVGRLQDGLPDAPPDVIVVSGAHSRQRGAVEELVLAAGPSTAICLFNCFLDTPDAAQLDGFASAYTCRYLPSTGAAVLQQRHGQPWDLFAETAVFEFEWTKTLPADWEPTEAGCETQLATEGYTKPMLGAKYFRSLGSARNAGFWPFHAIAQRAVLPLTAEYVKQQRQRSPKKILGFEIPS